MDGSSKGLVGRIVIDLRHEHIGTVVDVIFDDDSSDQPSVAVVDPGVLRSSRYVPISEYSRTGDGRLVVPYTAEQVKSGPKAGRDHVLTGDIRHAMDEHYRAD